MELQNVYSEYHPLLFSIAYRMLGTVSDAEDIVHDVYVTASEKSWEHAENRKAYFCKMVTNKSLDYLKSARKKREVYMGPWLPEPLILDPHDPVAEVMKGEAVSFAFLLLLEKLKPIERAVFILREVLEYEYAAIAQILGRSEPGCRKIFSRIKPKLPLIKEELKDVPHHQGIETFAAALQRGDLSKLEELLLQDVTIYSDGGGKVYAALKPVHSKKLVVRFIANLMEQNHDPEKPALFQFMTVNSGPGLLIREAGGMLTVCSFHVKQGQIADIYIVRNPEKLEHVKLPRVD
ncbi:RNA polymerase sigma factor SigJ [Peribacillus kribbensis]|uniref:RNA polymerase sigma factor SigJ n=1 Tax=Peribacillus kribbensis TaxID=356658 RepID=UPI000413CC65|nr:RNA polymerase sigma factor SigJ [Peribacillus kribbensis]